MRRQHPKRAITLLAAVIGLLAMLNLALLQSPVDISPIDQAKRDPNAPPAPSLGLSTPLDDKPATQFQEIVGRPLFNPNRRPAKQEPVTNDAQGSQPVELRLVGVMKSSDSTARALLRFSDGQAGKWIAEGEQFHGWTLRKIGERSVTVDAGGRRHELLLALPRRAADEAPAPDTGDTRR